MAQGVTQVTTPDQRITTRISTGELERRWSAIRREMKAHQIDALVMQSTNDWLGGYVKWFTDLPATNGYPRTVIFPADDEMTVIEMGPLGTARALDRNSLNRGVGVLLTPRLSYRLSIRTITMRNLSYLR